MPDPAPEPTPTLGEYLAVLKMHVDIANGEKQAIWTRHATMLVGNSIIVGAARYPGIAPLFLNIIGLLLCVAWAVMNWWGWGWFHKSLRAGAQVPIAPISNPFADRELSNPSFRRDPIFIAAMAVVGLFVLIYLMGICDS
jgi:hypothetical protein